MKHEPFTDPDCPEGFRFLVQLSDAKSSEDALAEAIEIFGHRYGKSPLNYAVRTGTYAHNGEEMILFPEGRRVYLKLQREA